MKSLLPLACGLLSSIALCAQVNFQQFPKPLQLYPRDLSSNTAQVIISGTATASPDSLIFSLEKNDGTKQRQAIAPNDLINQQFELSFQIEAGLWSYHFKAEQQTGASLTLLQEADNIVAGDVFVVNGQSNAQAVAYNGDADIWQNNFVRCFGTPNPEVFNDENWYVAEGNGYFSPGAVGQWALRMGNLLQENLQIPVAIINGADPGKPIEFFQRNDAQHNDPTTNYGRLLQRLINAGLTEHIRGLAYYQGESDGDRALIHKTLFEALHADWEEDLPNIEGYYIVQVREGCGAPTLQLREYQRAFEDYLHNAHAVTANGINGHDGCHYALIGYKTLGEKLYKQISADLYQKPTGEQTNIRVLSASFSNDLNTQITVLTDASSPLVAQPGSAYDFRIQSASAAVIGIQADGNKLILDLDQSVNTPEAALSYGGHAGSDAWILNGDGYGMFTFYNLPIENYHIVPNFDLPGIMSGAGNCVALDGADDYLYVGPILKNSYTKEAWINWQGGNVLNNIISGASGTAFWAPNGTLAAGHNGEWFQVADNSTLTPNQWVHVAVSYDAASGELKLYKNGKLVSQAQNIPGYTDPEVYVGAFGGCCTFQGKMDEVRVWDTVRSIEEIRANMCQKFPDTVPHLATYLRFDETAGNKAPNVTTAPDAQLYNFQGLGLNEAWRRSGAPIGTKSTYTYKPVDALSLTSISGDSLVLTSQDIPDFVHLYFVEEVPNVLEPADGYALVDNNRYFGVFYANQSIDHYDLQYHYASNPFAAVQQAKLGLLQRRNNAQSYWEESAHFLNNTPNQVMSVNETRYQEFILAIKDSVLLSPLSAQASVAQPILCSGVADGALEVVAEGGQIPYTFSLNGGAPQSSGVFAGLSPGSYSVLVMDNAGNAFTTNSIVLQNPNPLAVSIVVNDNNATVIISGGVPPYTLNSNAPDPNLQNLPNGNYTLTVTDANGCLFNALFTIDYQPLTITGTLVNPDNCDGVVDLVAIATGGNSPYEYSLNNGPFQSGNTFQDLPAGNYVLQVMDNEGKLASTNSIEISVPDLLLGSVAAFADTLIASVTGGTSPYTYSLDGGAAQLESVFVNLLPGDHEIKITDAAGCSISLSGQIIISDVHTPEASGQFLVNPNPSTGIFELRGENTAEVIQAAVLDVTGRRLQTFEIQAFEKSVSATIDLSEQADGIYFLQLKDGTGYGNIRLVKLH